MGKMSRNKGKRGEREVSKFLGQLLGIELRRSQQVKGTADSADIEPVDIEWNLHPEVKRTESTVSVAMYKALEQSVNDVGGSGKIPFVISRRNNHPWVIAIHADNLIEFCEEVLRIKNTVQK